MSEALLGVKSDVTTVMCVGILLLCGFFSCTEVNTLDLSRDRVMFSLVIFTLSGLNYFTPFHIF